MWEKNCIKLTWTRQILYKKNQFARFSELIKRKLIEKFDKEYF